MAASRVGISFLFIGDHVEKAGGKRQKIGKRGIVAAHPGVLRRNFSKERNVKLFPARLIRIGVQYSWF